MIRFWIKNKFTVAMLATIFLFSGAEISIAAKNVTMQESTGSKTDNAETESPTSQNNSSKTGQQPVSENTAQNGSDGIQENATPEQSTYPGVQNILYRSGNDNEPHAVIWYPSFGNEFVDSDIKYFVSVQGADFSKDIEDSTSDNEEKPASYDQWELTGFYTLSRPVQDIVSITFNIYSYTGGAHGNLFIRCLNYDLKNSKALELSDIFGNKEKALEILSAFTEKKLRSDLGSEVDEDMLAAGTAVEESNFLNLSLTKNGVVVEFQPYQVGPWAIGPQSVEAPIAELAEAKPNKNIWPDDESRKN